MALLTEAVALSAFWNKNERQFVVDACREDISLFHATCERLSPEDSEELKRLLFEDSGYIRISNALVS